MIINVISLNGAEEIIKDNYPDSYADMGDHTIVYYDDNVLSDAIAMYDRESETLIIVLEE